MAQAGKIVYLVANWKSHKSEAETREWLTVIKPPGAGVEVIVCPPFPYLPAAKSTALKLGAQDVSPYPKGAYTGAVAAEMLKEYVTYAIVGHSERRRYFHETDQEVANKVSLLQEAQIKPIICIDEPYLESQIDVLEGVDYQRAIFAYEPLAAIGSGQPDTPEHANNVAMRVKAATQSQVPVLYGGSVTSENIGEFLKMEAIGGALVGGASLDADQWQRLIEVVSISIPGVE